VGLGSLDLIRQCDPTFIPVCELKPPFSDGIPGDGILPIVQEIRHMATLDSMFAELFGWSHGHLLVQAFFDQLSATWSWAKNRASALATAANGHLGRSPSSSAPRRNRTEGLGGSGPRLCENRFVRNAARVATARFAGARARRESKAGMAMISFDFSSTASGYVMTFGHIASAFRGLFWHLVLSVGNVELAPGSIRSFRSHNCSNATP
jgi:hypothetical protein